MKKPHVDDRVRLRHDIPDLSLPRGSVGIVCSTWFAPTMAYEVEFPSPDHSVSLRALLEISELEMADEFTDHGRAAHC